MWTNRVRQPVTNFVTLSPRLARAIRPAIPSWRRYASTEQGTEQEASKKPSSSWFWSSLGFAGTGTAVFLAYTYTTSDGNKDEVTGNAKTKLPKVSEVPETLFVQKKRSLRSPGVYLWGTNSYRVVDPESKETVIKTPRNLSYFDGQILRDLKLDEKSGAAITEKGDLVQWGKGFSKSDFRPTQTLSGKNLTSLCMSSDRILALSSDGKVYSLPIAKDDQQSGRKPKEGSWVPFRAGDSSVSYRLLQPNLGLTEKVTAISGGQEHALLLTNSGRVFSVASSTENFPSFGQLGIPGLVWSTRPSGPVDTCHEITKLKDSKITQVATGDYHSLALSKDGRIFSFGDNSLGQLGVGYDSSSPFIDTPVSLPLEKLYRSKEWLPKVTRIAAGGANSFFTVDAQPTLDSNENSSTARDTADTWTCGRGIWGLLGNGKWTHMQDTPIKVKALSGLFEFDERTQKVSPIRLRDISVGTTHASTVMDNNAQIQSGSTKALETTDDWGYDALWWGGNEHFQLGTGKRSNLPRPTYINAPPGPEEKNDKQEARLQIMPRHKGKAGNRTVSMEQRVECGRHVSAIYSAT